LQQPPGFISVADANESVMGLMNDDPFISDRIFAMFNRDVHLDLDDVHALQLYDKFCETTPDYRGARNLMAWDDFAKCFQDHVLKSKPYLEIDGDKNEHYAIGSLWFELLYQIVISAVPEAPSRQDVRQLYDHYVNPKTGLMPMDRTYDVILRLGAYGLKFEQFKIFTARLGMTISEPTLLAAFQEVDMDQSQTLSKDEVKSVLSVLLRYTLAKDLLRQTGYSTKQIVLCVLGAVLLLCVVFAFLILSFWSLLGGSTTESGIHSLVQSGLAIMSSTIIGQSNSGQAEGDINPYLDRLLEATLGPGVRKAIRREKGLGEISAGTDKQGNTQQ